MRSDSEAITTLLEETQDMRALALALAFHGAALTRLVASGYRKPLDECLDEVTAAFSSQDDNGRSGS
jgi:hypothetical protein